MTDTKIWRVTTEFVAPSWEAAVDFAVSNLGYPTSYNPEKAVVNDNILSGSITGVAGHSEYTNHPAYPWNRATLK